MTDLAVRLLRVERATDRAALGKRVAVLAITDRGLTHIHRVVLVDRACGAPCPTCKKCRCQVTCSDVEACTCPTLFGVTPAGGRAS